MTRPTASARGQVLPLACIVFLTCALMMMASFSLANAVHERTRIQAAADAHAFTVATLEARGFNTMAFMNRAIAGAIVAEMGIHAWRALARHNVNMYQAGMIGFFVVAATEFAQCPKFQLQHCVHGFQALKIAFQYMKEYNSKKSELEGKDQQWKDAVKAYSELIKKINEDQKKILDSVKREIGMASMTLQDMLQKTAPKASINFMVHDYNKKGFACALEGSNFDDECESPGSWKSVGTVKSASDRTKIMESAAMAARTTWESGSFLERSASESGYRGSSPIGIPVYNPQKMMDIQDEGTYMFMGLSNKSSVSNNRISASSGMGIGFVQWKDGFGPLFVMSGSPPSTSSEYEGVPCDGSGGCFINFRLATQGGETDYGQPATYGVITQDLRKMRARSEQPWEIDGSGSVKMPNGDGTFTYVPKGQGFGVAKGKAYFHQLDNWAAPPNLFDPFWRAKLHPFVRDELKEILQKSGDMYGMQALSGQTAVEGVVQ
jgi:hypothetical protein